MTSRERFEAWYSVRGSKYWANVTPEQAAEDAWELAKRDALEQAAQKCDEEAKWLEDLTEHEQACGAHKCAFEIRALIEQDAQS